ncbi:MAG: 16S rRNA (cytosine(967)-C(5))-methyltransferase RsmB, partial [Lachnospiraceae bacterium]
PLVRNLLRMSVYQICYLDHIPDSAVCNEAVSLAKKRGFKSLSGFINGVLRNISRNKDKISFPDEKKDPILFLSVKYSMPEWIIKMWLSEYPYDIVEKMLASTLEERGTVVRVNLQKTTREELKEQLSKEMNVRDGIYLPFSLVLTQYDYLQKNSAFLDGKFQVQDESSMLVSVIADPKKNNFVVDVCAAPGGKTLHIAELLKEEGQVLSRDLTEDKIELIEDNIERMGYKNIKTEVFDALELDESLIGKADIVIADLPCSGLGVMAKKNDLKYRVTRDDIRELSALQRKILEVVSQYVKQGGILIYSTCTVTREENIENYRWIKENLAFCPRDFLEKLPEQIKTETAREGYLQLLPGVHACDGFFISSFKKR